MATKQEKGTSDTATATLERGQGILRLALTWVPRVVSVPGRRIKLHFDDYFALGGESSAVSCSSPESGVSACGGIVPDEARQNIDYMSLGILASLWSELKERQLIARRCAASSV